MRNIIGVLTLCLLTNLSFAQTTGKLSGLVKGPDGKPFDGASVEVMTAGDSLLVKMSMSGNEGRFELDGLADGAYLLAVTATGHNRYISTPISIEPANRNISLAAIQLVASSTQLKGVVVTARKPLIEQKIDRTIVNVEASITNTGSNALEVLEKSPGISVDKDGNISLKGRAGVMVMMDGKPTYLSGENLASYLRSLPASALDQIEIMTNPPAKYDAAGNSGVINIKTKKNRQKGFNGNASATYTQGRMWKGNSSVNLNYRNNKWNLFSNVNYWRWTGFNDIYVKRNFFEQGTKNIETVFEQNALVSMNFSGIEGKLGADFYANKKTTIGFVFTGSSDGGKDDNVNLSYIRNNTGAVTTIIDAFNIVRPTNRNSGVNLNYRYQFDSTGRELTADADHVYYQFSSSQKFYNRFLDGQGSKNREDEISKGDLPSLVKISSLKTDYTHPLKSGLKMEAGLKYSHVNTDNDAKYFRVFGDQEIIDAGRSNHFVYEEKIAAAYVNMNRQWKSLGIQAGLRAEHTTAKGRQFKNDSTVNRNYTNLFPTIYISYKAGEKNNFAASFGRRIERPSYQDMNPFRYFLDPYTYQEGNPFLKPQFSYNYQLSHSYHNFLTTTVNYSKTTDMFTETLNQIDDDTITYVFRQNLSRSDNYGLSVSVNFDVAKWWTSNIYGNVYYNYFNGLVGNRTLETSGTTALLNISNQFKFSKGWSAELSGFIRSKGVDAQIVVKPIGQMNLGLQKQVLNNKGTIKLSVRDAFFTMGFDADFKFYNVDARIKQFRDSRTVGLSFNYRFGKTNYESRKRNTGAEDEQNRVKKGGGA